MATQDFSVTKKKIGRPPGRTRPDTLPVRIPIDLIASVEQWIESQPAPRPSRPDAIRQLLSSAIAASTPAPRASLDEEIATAEAQIAQKVPTKPSPAKGMAKLRKGLAENDLKKLVAKKRRKAGDD